MPEGVGYPSKKTKKAPVKKKKNMKKAKPKAKPKKAPKQKVTSEDVPGDGLAKKAAKAIEKRKRLLESI